MKTKRNLIHICLLGAVLLAASVAQAQIHYETVSINLSAPTSASNNSRTAYFVPNVNGNATVSFTLNASPPNGFASFAVYTNTDTTLLGEDYYYSGNDGPIIENFGSQPIAVSAGTTYYLEGYLQWNEIDSFQVTVSYPVSDYLFTTNKGAITITGYTGSGGAVTIPSTINGYTVIGIGDNAFWACTSLTTVTIPASVTSIGNEVFNYCNSLTAIMVDTNNPAFSSVNGVLFDKVQTTLVAYPEGLAGTFYKIQNSVTSIGYAAFLHCTSLTGITIPNSVTSIGYAAFGGCSSLTSVTIPASVANIGDYAFNGCYFLTAAYFEGNAPPDDSTVFNADTATVYYLPGTTGWGARFGSIPAVLWNPHPQTSGVSFGVRTNRFGFNITGSSNLVIVVEACTNLANSSWTPVGTNTLNTFIGTNGTSYFSDPQWTNYPGRFYRLRSP